MLEARATAKLVFTRAWTGQKQTAVIISGQRSRCATAKKRVLDGTGGGGCFLDAMKLFNLSCTLGIREQQNHAEGLILCGNYENAKRESRSALCANMICAGLKCRSLLEGLEKQVCLAHVLP